MQVNNWSVIFSIWKKSFDNLLKPAPPLYQSLLSGDNEDGVTSPDPNADPNAPFDPVNDKCFPIQYKDLSFQHERARSSGTGRVIDEGISYKVPADRD